MSNLHDVLRATEQELDRLQLGWTHEDADDLAASAHAVSDMTLAGHPPREGDRWWASASRSVRTFFLSREK